METWQIGDKEYQMALTAGSLLQIEKKTGLGFFELLGKMDNFSYLFAILWGALQKHHSGLNEDDVADLFDEYMEKGGNLQSLLELLMQVLKEAGFAPVETAATGKKATTKK